MKIVDIKPNTPEWHEWRKGGIGSSDIAAIMGVSPWTTAKHIYYEKKGIGEERKQTQAMRKGQMYEDEARRKFNALRLLEFKPICIERLDYPFMRASLDGYSAEEDTILEIKIPGKKDMALAANGEIPEYYNLQIQWQLMVSEARHGYFVCYSPETEEMYVITVHQDALLREKLKQEAVLFWNNFENTIPPEAQKGDYDMIFDPELENLVEKYIEMKRSIEVEERILDTYRNQILQFGGGQNFKAYGITVTQAKPRLSYDIDGMRAAGIDIDKFERYSNTTQSFRITINK